MFFWLQISWKKSSYFYLGRLFFLCSLQHFYLLNYFDVINYKFTHVVLVIAENRYIAKTLYGTEEEEDTPQPNTKIEEPKLLGFNSGSNEKVCSILALVVC